MAGIEKISGVGKIFSICPWMSKHWWLNCCQWRWPLHHVQFLDKIFWMDKLMSLVLMLSAERLWLQARNRILLRYERNTISWPDVKAWNTACFIRTGYDFYSCNCRRRNSYEELWQKTRALLADLLHEGIFYGKNMLIRSDDRSSEQCKLIDW